MISFYMQTEEAGIKHLHHHGNLYWRDQPVREVPHVQHTDVTCILDKVILEAHLGTGWQ